MILVRIAGRRRHRDYPKNGVFTPFSGIFVAFDDENPDPRAFSARVLLTNSGLRPPLAFIKEMVKINPFNKS